MKKEELTLKTRIKTIQAINLLWTKLADDHGPEYLEDEKIQQAFDTLGSALQAEIVSTGWGYFVPKEEM